MRPRNRWPPAPSTPSGPLGNLRCNLTDIGIGWSGSVLLMARRTKRLGRLGVATLALLIAGCARQPAAAPSQVDVNTATPPVGSAPIETLAATEKPPSSPVAPYAPADFWAGVAPGGNNDEHYTSLDGMTKPADVVVVGTVTRISQDSTRHTDLSPTDGAFAQLDFKVEQVLSGTPEYAASGVLNVELFMTDPRQYRQFAAQLPAERVLVFLRNKAVEARQNGWPVEGPDTGHLYYRVVSDQGVIRAVDGKAVANDDGGGFLSAVNKASFDQVISDVQAAAR